MKSGHNAVQSRKKKLQICLVRFILIAFLGLFLGLCGSIGKFVEIAQEQVYLPMTTLWLTAVFAGLYLWLYALSKSRFSSRALRGVVITSASIIYLFSLVWTFCEYHWKGTRDCTPLGYTTMQSINLARDVAHAQPPERTDFRIVSFYLNDELCSFAETYEYFSGKGPKKYRTFSFDHAVYSAFQRGQCVGPRGNRPIQDVLFLLHRRLEKIGQQGLIGYIRTADDLARVARERRDLFERLIFTSADLEEMKDHSPQDFAKVKEWMLTCVGIYQPVLTLVIKNFGARSVTLTDVIYEVMDVGSVKGGLTGPIYPGITYNHTLRHEEGNQEFQLKPPIQINAGESYSFNLRLFSGKKGWGLAWLLKIRIMDPQGNSTATEPVQIIMSKGR